MTDLVPKVGDVDVVVVLGEDVPLCGCPGVHLGGRSDLRDVDDLRHLAAET